MCNILHLIFHLNYSFTIYVSHICSIHVQYNEVRTAIAQRKEAKRRVKRVLQSAPSTEEPLASSSSSTSTASASTSEPALASSSTSTSASTDRLPMKGKPRLISAAIDPKVFPDSDDDDDDDPITIPVSAQTSGEEDLPLESSCSTLDSPLVAFSAPPSPSPPNTPSAFEASIGPDWRAGLASAENDDDDDDFKEAVEKVEPVVKDKVDAPCVGNAVAVNNAAEGETEVEEEDEDATQCAADIECSPMQARFNVTSTTNANSSDSGSGSSSSCGSISGVAGIEVKCGAMTIQEKLKNIDAAARTSHATSVSEPLTSSSATASRELWMGKGTLSPIMSPASSRLSSPVPASTSTSASAVKSVGGGFILKALGQGQGADRDGDDSGDGGEDLGEIVNKATPEKAYKEDYSSGSQNSEKQRLNQSYSRNGSQNNTAHSSSSCSSGSGSSSARYQHHVAKFNSLNNINAIDANKANRQSQGPHKNRNLSDALSGKRTSISKPTQETFYSKKS